MGTQELVSHFERRGLGEGEVIPLGLLQPRGRLWGTGLGLGHNTKMLMLGIPLRISAWTYASSQCLQHRDFLRWMAAVPEGDQEQRAIAPLGPATK